MNNFVTVSTITGDELIMLIEDISSLEMKVIKNDRGWNNIDKTQYSLVIKRNLGYVLITQESYEYLKGRLLEEGEIK